MNQYLLLIHSNEKTPTTGEEWDRFFIAAKASGTFTGGSEIGQRMILGAPSPAHTSGHIAGYMRFDSADKQVVLDLLTLHPVVIHGGSVELCDLPKS